MIKYYYKSLRSEMKDLPKYQRGAWIYVEDPSEDEIQKLVKDFSLTEGHVRDALDEDEMPRLENEGEQTYAFIRVATILRGGDFDTVPLLFIFGGDWTITISLKRLTYIDAFMAGKVEFATTQRTKLILQITHLISEQYDIYISRTSKQIKTIRARLRGHEITNKDFIDFVTIEDELNEFLSALMPTNAMLRRLAMGRHLPLYDEDKDIVEDLLLNNEQSIDACRSNIKSISSIRGAYQAISSNNLNRTIKILTLVTVLITLPNIVFGMYGMNVHLPFAEEVWAFVFVLGLVTLLLFLALVLLKRKRVL